jgi:hypothetical protein
MAEESGESGVAPFVTARGTELELAGKPYRFLGVNVYSLASFPEGSGKYFCGIAHGDKQVTEIIAEVAAMGGNAIRLDAYQSFTDGGRDFSRLDFIIAEAKKRGIKLVLTLENQWRDCTEGGYKYADWYRSGFRQPYGAYRLSFVEYVKVIVARYRDEPTILMWQLMNEAESRTSLMIEDPDALHAFAVEMAKVVKGIDSRHLLSLGTHGIDRPGMSGDRFEALARISGIDIIEAHDYGADREAIPSSIRKSMAVAARAGKPFFIGEVGISSPPMSREERAKLTRAKLDAAWSAGTRGILVWSYRAGDGTNRDFDAADPLAGELRDFTKKNLPSSGGKPCEKGTSVLSSPPSRSGERPWPSRPRSVFTLQPCSCPMPCWPWTPRSSSWRR